MDNYIVGYRSILSVQSNQDYTLHYKLQTHHTYTCLIKNMQDTIIYSSQHYSDVKQNTIQFNTTNTIIISIEFYIPNTSIIYIQECCLLPMAHKHIAILYGKSLQKKDRWLVWLSQKMNEFINKEYTIDLFQSECDNMDILLKDIEDPDHIYLHTIPENYILDSVQSKDCIKPYDKILCIGNKYYSKCVEDSFILQYKVDIYFTDSIDKMDKMNKFSQIYCYTQKQFDTLLEYNNLTNSIKKYFIQPIFYHSIQRNKNNKNYVLVGELLQDKNTLELINNIYTICSRCDNVFFSIFYTNIIGDSEFTSKILDIIQYKKNKQIIFYKNESIKAVQKIISESMFGIILGNNKTDSIPSLLVQEFEYYGIEIIHNFSEYIEYVYSIKQNNKIDTNSDINLDTNSDINLDTNSDKQLLERFIKYKDEYYDIELYKTTYNDLQQLNDRQLIQHYIHNGCQEGRYIRYINVPQNKYYNNLDYSIIGYFNGLFGLAENSRQLYTALDTNKQIVKAVDSQVPWHTFTYDFKANYISTLKSDSSINIFCINWNEELPYMTGKFYDMTQNKANVVLWAFEVEKVLPIVTVYEKYFPKIFTISDYCKKTLIDSGIHESKVITLYIPSIDYTQIYSNRLQSIEYFKTRFDKNLFYVGFVFDFCSSLNRKNVLDTIQVFSDSIASFNNCYLIIKYINHNNCTKDYIRFRKKIDHCLYKHKIIEIQGSFSKGEMIYLYSIFNVYISLHRAEGSGLTIMDCIYRGIPTICTAYSGNLDFCTKFNSFLVDYTYTKIPKDDINYGRYTDLCQWAQPNLETAKNHLLNIYQNYEKCCDDIQKYKYYIENKYNPYFLGKQIVGSTVSFIKKDYSNKKILFVIHFGNHINILDEYLQKIYNMSSLQFDIIIGMNQPTLKESLFSNYYFKKMKQKIEIVEYGNYGMNCCGYLHMFKHCRDIDSYDLIYCLHTKSVKEWRDGIIGDILNQHSIETIYNYIDINPNTGLISAKNTIMPIFNNRQTIEELCKLYQIDTSFYDSYHDEHAMFYEQVMDIYTYLNNYIDVKINYSNKIDIHNHWTQYGKLEKRICDRSLNESLMYNCKYPLFNAGNIQVLNPKVIKFWKYYIGETLELCKTEVNKLCDTGKSTYTHALERIPGIICHHLKLDLCEIDYENIIIKRQY